ncbi:glycoside hydrolase family 88 protein [Pseudoduganella sp. OTU4001]|uniref:glycoside hydrolase family 88 protein n=1 Tax=Pseudoduganella sp. OTU4001 TaxID=3043854 RepID=UPI00313D8D05
MFKHSSTRHVLAGLVASACLVQTAQAGAEAQALAPAVVLATMEKVADWQLAHPTGYPLDDWTEGVGDAGFMALAGISGSDKYREAMRAAGEKNQWKLGPSMFHADDYVVGQMYAELYLHTRQPYMIAPLRAQFDYMLANPRPGSLDWKTPGVQHRWSWCDALFMGPPAWARLTAATGDQRYLEFAISEWWRTSDYLYDKEEHLYFRDSRFFDKREANGKKMFWGRGNGWVMGGLVRMLQYIPEQHPQRGRFIQQYKEMAERLLGLQQPDGLWRSSLLDPVTYSKPESSGTALYTYALAWGVNQGILPREQFAPAVKRAWQTLSSHVKPDGKLVHVQPIGEDPRFFDPNSSDVFAVGGFLLAGSEMYRMALQEGSQPRVVTVSNGTGLFRPEESVEVAGAGDGLAVMDALTSRILPSQVLGKTLLFQADLAPNETRRYLLLPRKQLPAVPTVVSRAHARFVPERLDDFAWENDRVAHRTYGPAIMNEPKEMLVSSGIDVWSKSARKLVQDAWYRGGDYHKDKGEGMDFYHVGKTRGCGGLGIYDGKELRTSSNYSSWKVLADGPLRTVFELKYDAWDAGGRLVSETRRISLDAGSNFNRVESSFTSPSAATLTIGVGIVQREGQGRYQQGAGTMSYWEPAMGENGSNACAVIVPGASGFLNVAAAAPKALEAGHYLALASAQPKQAFVYYLGSAWSKGGDFADAKAWESYVATTAARVAAPVKVSVSR